MPYVEHAITTRKPVALFRQVEGVLRQQFLQEFYQARRWVALQGQAYYFRQC